MANITLIEKDGFLKFIDSNRDNVSIYSINLNLLNNTIGLGVSEWISQLYIKSWANSNLLYEVAKIITKHFPINDIDWESTFFPVEKKDYLDKYIGLGNEFENTGIKDDFLKRVEIGKQENILEVNEFITEIVRRNLRENGIQS